MNGELPNIKKWIILYPVYMNSKKTIAEGRRISVEKACENPTCAEIVDYCKHLKLDHCIEDKAYPRDFMLRGRVRVMLKREDGTLCNPVIPSRKELMIRVAELVPKHPGRTKKQEVASSSSSSVTSKSGKGGRKKRKNLMIGQNLLISFSFEGVLPVYTKSFSLFCMKVQNILLE